MERKTAYLYLYRNSGTNQEVQVKQYADESNREYINRKSRMKDLEAKGYTLLDTVDLVTIAKGAK